MSMSTTNKDDFSPSDDSRNDSVTDDNHTEAIIDHQPPHLTRRSKFHRVQTGPTPNGTGLFAAASFKTDTAIGHITGTIQPPGYRSEYCMGFRDGALEPDVPYRYLNHSCDPNCELIEWEILNEETGESVFELWLHTVRPVRRGEELTIDYGWDHLVQYELSKYYFKKFR